MLKHQFDDSLTHFGVKGMRWGVRKKTDHKPRKHISEMSNDELQAVITRGNLERQYAALQPKSRLSKFGSKFQNKIEDNLANAASKISLNVMFAVGDFSVSRLKDPESIMFTKHGEQVYNAYKNIIRR